jgi:hypothetical protein
LIRRVTGVLGCRITLKRKSSGIRSGCLAPASVVASPFVAGALLRLSVSDSSGPSTLCAAAPPLPSSALASPLVMLLRLLSRESLGWSALAAAALLLTASALASACGCDRCLGAVGHFVAHLVLHHLSRHRFDVCIRARVHHQIQTPYRTCGDHSSIFFPLRSELLVLPSLLLRATGRSCGSVRRRLRRSSRHPPTLPVI